MKRIFVALWLCFLPVVVLATVTPQTDKTGPFTITGLPQLIPVGFPFQQGSDLVVLDEGSSGTPRDPAITLTLGSDYSVTGGGYNSQNQMQLGSITVVGTGANAVLTNDLIVIMRGVPINQTTSFLATGPLTINIIEQALDKLATLSQQVNEIGGRSLQFENFEFLSPTLVRSARENNLLGFDSNGNITYIPSQTATGYVSKIIAGTNVTISPTGGQGAVTVNATSGSTSPGGSTTQIQYNNAGAFGGTSGMTWNGSLLNNTQTGNGNQFVYSGSNANGGNHAAVSSYLANDLFSADWTLTSSGYSGSWLTGGGPSGETFNIYTTSSIPIAAGVNNAAGWYLDGSNNFFVLHNETVTGLLTAGTTTSSVNSVINVKAPPYSAAGNGTADDTTAIQSALNAAAGGSLGVTTVFFPQGRYKISSPLTLPIGVSMKGVGAIDNNGSSLWGSEIFGVIGNNFAVSQDVTTYGSDANSFSTISDLSIQVTTTTAGGCIYFKNAAENTVRNCYLLSSAGSSVITCDADSISDTFDSNVFAGSPAYCISFIGQIHNQVSLRNNYCSGGSIAGLYINCENGTWTDYGDIYEACATGIVINGDITANGNNPHLFGYGQYFEANTAYAISVNPGAYNTGAPSVFLHAASNFGDSIETGFMLYGTSQAVYVDGLVSLGCTGETFNFGTVTGLTVPLTLTSIQSSDSTVMSSTPSAANATDYIWRSGYTAWGLNLAPATGTLTAAFSSPPVLGGTTPNVVHATTLTTTGKVTTYNGAATAGIGVTPVVSTPRLAAQTGAVSLAAYTVPAADSSYEVSANVNIVSNTTDNFTVTCTYTDETNASRTLTLGFTQLSGATFITAITNVTGTGPYESPVYHIRCKASTTITFATTGTFTTVSYNIEGTVVQLQ